MLKSTNVALPRLHKRIKREYKEGQKYKGKEYYYKYKEFYCDCRDKDHKDLYNKLKRYKSMTILVALLQ